MPEYSVFGLRVRSERPLPELPPATGPSEPDVTVRFGTIDSECHDAGLHRLKDAILFVAPDAARYRITGGHEILVEPVQNAHDRNIRLYLLGSAFGAIIHQRGLLPLHANAVEIEGQAFAFMGAQGEGKSTLAAWFHDRGHRIVADDICVIAFHGEKPMAMPGLPRLRLWEDALVQSGRTVGEFERSFEGADDWNKFDLPVAPDRSSRKDLPLSAIYLVESGENFSVQKLEGMKAAEVLFEHTYRGGYLEAANGQRQHLQSIVELVRAIPVFRLTRKRGFDVFEDQAAAVLKHVLSLAAAP